MTKAELARILGMRWPVEVTFEQGKQEVGLDAYAVRSWHGWHYPGAILHRLCSDRFRVVILRLFRRCFGFKLTHFAVSLAICGRARCCRSDNACQGLLDFGIFVLHAFSIGRQFCATPLS